MSRSAPSQARSCTGPALAMLSLSYLQLLWAASNAASSAAASALARAAAVADDSGWSSGLVMAANGVPRAMGAADASTGGSNPASRAEFMARICTTACSTFRPSASICSASVIPCRGNSLGLAPDNSNELAATKPSDGLTSRFGLSPDFRFASAERGRPAAEVFFTTNLLCHGSSRS